jgi:hypothetical protein
VAWPPNPAPHADRPHQAIAIEQRKVLPHAHSADLQRHAQLCRGHIAVPPEQRQYPLARLALLAMIQSHAPIYSILMPDRFLMPMSIALAFRLCQEITFETAPLYSRR